MGELAKKHGLIYCVDNCFATPIGQLPAQYGADLMVHSATKWLDGQGRVLGGIVLGSKKLIHEIYFFCRSTGPSLSPFNAWVLSRSLETLEVRMERHASNALYLAEQLRKSSGHQLAEISFPQIPSAICHCEETNEKRRRTFLF